MAPSPVLLTGEGLFINCDPHTVPLESTGFREGVGIGPATAQERPAHPVQLITKGEQQGVGATPEGIPL